MKIVFVYNAKSGIGNSLLDIGHKVLSPNTYKCNLCALTFGLFSENAVWKKYRESSNYELEFLHKDEFEKIYNEKRVYPIILGITKDNNLIELIDRERISNIKSVNELIREINEVL